MTREFRRLARDAPLSLAPVILFALRSVPNCARCCGILWGVSLGVPRAAVARMAGDRRVSWRVRVLASTATAAGLPARRASRSTKCEIAADAGDRLAAAAADASVGIILVEQRLLDAVPPAVRRAVDRRPLPIIVPIPAPNWTHGPSDAEGYIVELLRRAIGYRVRLQ